MMISNWFMLFIILFEYWMIFASAMLAEYLDIFFIKCIVVFFIGCRMRVLATAILHECSHYNFFDGISINKFFGQYILGIPFFKDYYEFRDEHILHHSSSMTDDDELLHTFKTFNIFTDKSFFYIYIIQPLIGLTTYHYFKETDFETYIKCAILYIPVMCFIVYHNLSYYFMLYWVIPSVYFLPIITYWVDLAEHYGTKCKNKYSARSNIYYLPLIFSYGEGYHYAHHMNQNCKWYDLKKTHNELLSQNKIVPDDISNSCFETYSQMSKYHHSRESCTEESMLSEYAK